MGIQKIQKLIHHYLKMMVHDTFPLSYYHGH
jgi:hypothetical protein